MRKTPPLVGGPCIMFRVMFDHPLLKENNNNKQTKRKRQKEKERKNGGG